MSTADDSLYLACLQGSKHRVLELANQNNVNYVYPRFGDTPLHQACKKGWLDIVEKLIEKYGCDPNVVTKSGESLLHYACRYGHIDIVTLLIENYSCDPNVVTESNEGLLHYACLHHHIDIIKLLIKKYGCDPNVTTMSGKSLLHYACYGGHINIVKLLIEKYGCDPNVLTNNNESLLHYACQHDHIDIVILLIEKYGCDPNVVTKSNQSLLHYACRCGNVDIIKYLIINQHLNPLMRDSINQSEPLDYAINNNKYSISVYLCRHNISSDEMLSPNRIKTTVNLIKFIALRTDTCQVYGSIEDQMWKTANGDNILQLVGSSKMHIAHMPSAVVSNSHNASCIIRYFKPDLRTADGDTILQLVCKSRRVVSQISSMMMMNWLSDSTDLMKIDTLIGTTADGNNLLELICQSEKCLIQISSTVFLNWLRKTVLRSVTIAIPDCKTADGDTLLQLILRSEMSISRISSCMLAKLLTNSKKITINEMKNINPNWKTVDEAHFPHVLCLSNIESDKVTELSLMQYYIFENGWNPDTPDGEGNTVLHIACQTDKLALVSYLIDQAQCNPNIENSEGNLPIDMTTNLEVINYLCQHDQISLPSSTIIKWISNYDNVTIECILQSLVDNHKTITRDGRTLLHVVCTCSTLHETKRWVEHLLIECQCDPNCLDSKGQMPLQLISDSVIMKVLIEHGAKMTTDCVFKVIFSTIMTDSRAVELMALSSRKGTMLWQPTDLSKNNKIALDHAYILYKLNIVNHILTEVKCDPSANNVFNLLLKLTTNLNVAKILIKHGARVTPELVLRFEDMEAKQNKDTLFELMLKTWKANDRDSDGYTALHLACKHDRHGTVKRLLSIADCDPNIKSNSEEMPIQLTSNFKIMKLLVDHSAKMTTDVVFKLISMDIITDNKLSELLKTSKTKGQMLWNPNALNSDGYTALHLACKIDRPKTVIILLSVANSNPNIKSNNDEVPIQLTSNLSIMETLVEHGAQMTTDVVFKLISMHSRNPRVPELFDTSTAKGTMLWNPNDLNSDGYTALHLACKADSFIIVKSLLSVAHCDPNVKGKYEEMPIQLTPDLSINIMKILIKHGAQVTTDVVFKLISKYNADSRVLINELFKITTTKGTILRNPNDLNSNGYTALHLACKIDSLIIVNYLLSVAHCDPNVESKYEEMPIQFTSNLSIMETLVEHGAQMTTNVVFKLISKHHTDSRVSELFEISIARETILSNPNYLNSDGYTALHLACKAEYFIIVKYLLSVAHCDPNIKGGIDGYTALHLACKAENSTIVKCLLSVGHCDPNINSNSDEVPLQLTTNSEIIKDLIRYGAKTSMMYKSYKKALGTNKPLQPPVKVFVVGNPSVGKSTLTAALRTEKWIIAQFFSSEKVSGVDEKTVGIVPHDFESGYFGRVTLYDFAGHREFYSGHAALLQTAIQSTPPIFLLVINLSEDDSDIIKNILYWILFLENQCASITCRPHIILVGSHADTLKEVNPKDKVKSIFSTLDTKCFTNMEYIGFVAMNCQLHESTGMSDLRRLLIKSCQELRIKEPITFNAHCFLVYLIDKFINVTAVTIKNVSETINNQKSKEGVLEFLPTNFDMLYKICLELNDRGHILLLKDRITVENSYVIIDKEFLLSKISGTVFAPEGFEQYKDLSSNTGVAPLSKIAHCFPDSDTNILIAFFTHLEFCHEISDQDLLRQIAKDQSQALNSKERYYLFPGLISLEAESDVWEMESHFSHHFGWTLQCTNLEQFLTSRFLQVLLLRLAFSLALESKCDGIGIHRKCSIWKNGIFWGRGFGMEILVEIIEDKSVIVITRFQTSNLEKCLKHRSEVIRTVLECHNRFCPRVSVAESFIDTSSPLRYPSAYNFDKTLCTVQAFAESVVRNEPLVVLSCGKTILAERFLSFEPYAEMELLVLQELWDENNKNKIISDNYLLKFVQKAMDGLSYLIKVISGSSTSSTSENQLYQDLLRWRDSDKTNKKTYKDLRQAMNQYSVFAGRNVLDLAGDQHEPLSDNRKEESQINEAQNLLSASRVEDRNAEKMAEVLKDSGMIKSTQLDGDKDQSDTGAASPAGNETQSAGVTHDELPMATITVKGKRPELYELQILEFDKGMESLRIMEKVTPKWKQVAIALGFNGSKIKTIEMGALRQPEDACLSMFSDWLDGGHDLQPPTWDILIQSLRAANIPEIVDLLKFIKIGASADEAPMTVDTKTQEASTTATTDAVSGSIQVKSAKYESESTTTSGNSELAGALQAKQGSSIKIMLNIEALEELEGRGGRKVKVLESIRSEWEEVAKALDMGQEDIDMIKTRHSDDDEKACREMLATWLEGNTGEVSWTALTQALIDAGLPELADNLKDILN